MVPSAANKVICSDTVADKQVEFSRSNYNSRYLWDMTHLPSAQVSLLRSSDASTVARRPREALQKGNFWRAWSELVSRITRACLPATLNRIDSRIL